MANHNGGRSITEHIQRAAKKAIKQGEAGLGGKRSLAALLDDVMQNDPLAFLKAVAPYCPKEVIIDHSISIVSALEEARQRIIDVTPQTALLEHQQAFIQAPGLDQTQQMADVLCDDENSQGGV